MLDRAGCIAVEPALAGVAEKFVGGLRLPGDETGDCFKFTTALAELATGLGVRFVNDTTIDEIRHDGGRITDIATKAGLMTADAYVLALGSYSPLLADSLGLRLPVYPVRSEEHTSELQSLMRISYAVFFLKK